MLGQCLVFAVIVGRTHCISHIAGCEDNIKTVAQLIEPKDDLVTVDIKKRVPSHQNT